MLYDVFGSTALMFTASTGAVDYLRKLVDVGADTSLVDEVRKQMPVYVLLNLTPQ